MRPVRGAVWLLTVLMLVACSSGAADEPERTTSVPAETSEAPTTATPTESTPAPPEMPPEAREGTPEGAAAFVRYYFELVNHAYATGDTTPIKGASHPDCKTCANVIDQVDQRYSTGGQIEGGKITVVSAEASPLDDVNISLVSTVYNQSPLKEFDGQGNLVDAGDGGQGLLVAFYAEFEGGAWKAFGIAND